MNLYRRIYSSLAVIFIVCCSFFVTNNNYQTECVSLDTDGYYTIKIWDTRKGANYKAEDARKDAIHAILFAGIAAGNGCSTQSAFLSKIEEQEKFKNIENDFFSKKGKWRVFTRNATTATMLPVSLGKKEWKVYQVAVSKKALREYLEELKIIKSLNNQF